MSFHVYPAILEGDADTGFGVYFPDLPGCVTAGDSATEAAINAAEALALHLEGLIAEGLLLPPPSDLAVIRAEAGSVEAARLLVTAYAADPTPRRKAS